MNNDKQEFEHEMEESERRAHRLKEIVEHEVDDETAKLLAEIEKRNQK